MANIMNSRNTIKDYVCKPLHQDEQSDKEPLIKDTFPSCAMLTDAHAIDSGKGYNDPGKATDDASNGPAAKQIWPSSEVRLPSSIDSGALREPSIGTRGQTDKGCEQAEKRLEKMCGAVRTLLECVGEDPGREGLLATPSRYAKALLSFTSGYQANVDTIVNNALFQEGHKEMVVVKDIEIFSLCEHHLVPFTGKIHISYIPSGTVIGLSKLSRIAEMYSRRLQIQERLTREVAQAIMTILSPLGVAVVMESCHLCMVMRGVEKTGTTTITMCALGCFESKPEVRDEFLRLIGLQRR